MNKLLVGRLASFYDDCILRSSISYVMHQKLIAEVKDIEKMGEMCRYSVHMT